ncbi:MAG TPA: sugar ABC transporter ATP-binding protein [Rectinemataceae bacterium]|nr:sugar ABC transporter ATP-binding protein [Rectinemataceae bacterium]
MSDEYILEMAGIQKSFPGVRALKGVNLAVRPGTVHGVMGENGAGKSTLMKIAIGLYHPDAGSIRLRGKPASFVNVHDALSRGISMIHQEMSPLPYMTVAQNIFLGREIKNKLGLINHRAIDVEAGRILSELKIDIKPRQIMGKLSVAQMQLVEIAEAVSRGADLIIMDEPTSALTEKEVAHLFSIIRSLKDRGTAVIYITHKLDEVFAITDEVTVYRDGEFVGHESSAELTRERLIKMMVGRTVDQFFQKETATFGEPVLEVEGLTRRGYFRDISFSVRSGEILGVAGLVGAGRTEVMESLFGYAPKQAGTIRMRGKPIRINNTYDAIRAGIAFLTEDRKRTGLYLNLSVRDNIIMPSIRNNLAMLLVKHKALRKICTDAVASLRIKTPSLSQPVMFLSGGNQQKVLVSRWLATAPSVLILDEPTRGIDVATKSEIYKLMSNLAKEGKAIILISSEMPEILAMSDRIMVMHEGSKVGEIDRAEATQEKILHMATGESLSTFEEKRYY